MMTHQNIQIPMPNNPHSICSRLGLFHTCLPDLSWGEGWILLLVDSTTEPNLTQFYDPVC